jgi:sodium/hydrogen antiporter
MSGGSWFLLIGGLFVVMALSGTVLRRLPLTTGLVYLAAGFALGPHGLGLLRPDLLAEAALFERVTEIAVLISLFSSGLKLRAPLSDDRWRLPVWLAFGSMALTVGLIAAVAMLGLGLPPGAAILLGAILAPTDPVLAADVQVADAADRDRVRFSLTGEAGLNDGAAFPFVMLGLGLLGQHELGAFGWRWLAVDVAWATFGGLLLGAALGSAVGHLVLYLRRHHKEAVGTDDFLALGLIAAAYGAAVAAAAYGFLAVFAAGVALRRIERREAHGAPPAPAAVVLAGDKEALATDPEKAPAYMAEAVLGFNEQLARIAEVGVVLLIGALLSPRDIPAAALWFIPLVFLGIRPAAAAVGLAGTPTSRLQRALISWFGIRGIGSLYYLSYALTHGLSPELGRRLAGVTLATVAASIFAHGVSVTPLMNLYRRTRARERQRPESRPGGP